MIFNIFVLLVAILISIVSAYYSITGLTTIFAASYWSVMIMGISLELGKITAVVWLHKYWNKADWKLKSYLLPAVIVLMLITSMGTYGYLARAHIDQGVPTSDVAAKVALIDEKIKIQKENIATSRAAMAQLDAQVNARLDRGTTEQGAERAVVIRRQQQAERNRLLKEVSDAQAQITKLNEERAPIASELRKVEAEVGPIKYIAALIYGDNPDQSLLESAVRWVIILIVLVFDPLALTLVLAANSSRKWEEDLKEQVKEPVVETSIEDKVEEVSEPMSEEVKQYIEEVKDEFNLKNYPYLFKPWVWFTPGIPPVTVKDVDSKPVVTSEPTKEPETIVTTDSELSVSDNTPISELEPEPSIVTDGVTKEKVDGPHFTEISPDYVSFEGKQMRREALQSLHPEFFVVKPDSSNQLQTDFGIRFPEMAKKGQIYVRVDVLPNRVFKFDGNTWIEVQKDNSDTYLHNQRYIQYLVDKIEKGEYDIELLSDTEKEEIAKYLGNQNS